MKGAAINFAASIAIYLLADAGVSALDTEKLTRHRKEALPTRSLFDSVVDDRLFDDKDLQYMIGNFASDNTNTPTSMSMPTAAPSFSMFVPTASPTTFPTSSSPTSSSPTSSSPTTAVPSHRPSATPSPNCINAGTFFMRTDVRSGDEAFLNCQIVDASPEKWCDKGGATHCPKACDTCPTEGCEDSKALFKTRFKNTLTCSFNSYQSGDVVRMCQDPNIRQACRSTCGFCKPLQ
jgi:hypothetical protein